MDLIAVVFYDRYGARTLPHTDVLPVEGHHPEPSVLVAVPRAPTVTTYDYDGEDEHGRHIYREHVTD